MRILEPVQRESGGARRVEAEVVWEDAPHEPQRLWFTGRGVAAEAIRPEPQAFLLAAAVPALRAHERRIALEGSVSPRLRDGLARIFQNLAAWYDPTRPLPRLEPSEGFRARATPTAPRAASFLSCGLDSLALLRSNRRDFPLDHPAAIRDAIFVGGFDIGIPGTGGQSHFLDRAARAAERVADAAGVELLVVETNLRRLERHQGAWPDEWFGAACASVAHALSGRISTACVASGLCMSRLFPHGSHPLLDPQASSDEMEIRLEGLHQTRLEKAAGIADWDVALDHLRVCWAGIDDHGGLNCGRCHKCVITMLELLLVGALGHCRTLPGDDLVPAQLEAIRETTASSLPFLEELREPLADRGRRDLLAPLERKIERIRQGQRRRRPRRAGRLASRFPGRAP